MATIYKFVVETRTRKGSGRNADTGDSGKGSGKRKTVTLLGSMKGGVEHNRWSRAINPLLNKATGGVWEKGMRLGRAGLGLVKFDKETGAFAGLSGVAITIIISFVIQTLLKLQARERTRATQINYQNYKAMENGFSSIHGAYKVSADVISGRLTYNENK